MDIDKENNEILLSDYKGYFDKLRDNYFGREQEYLIL